VYNTEVSEMQAATTDSHRENFRRTVVHHTTVGEASKAARDVDKADSRERGKALPGPGSMVLASAGPPW